jgi:NTP pyrophosphatase (non-canonical NTP hydrolase)
MRHPMQEKVARFELAHQSSAPAPARLLDLASEVGELAKEMLKSTAYGRLVFETSSDWESEMGDVLYSLVALANVTEVDLDHALDGALEKYAKRIEVGGNPSSS